MLQGMYAALGRRLWPVPSQPGMATGLFGSDGPDPGGVVLEELGTPVPWAFKRSGGCLYC